MVVQEENSDVSPENLENQDAQLSSEDKIFSLEILKIIKDAQQQHGLRHSDYQRYRGYCSRRLRRLRKVLKVPQGDRRHFKRRDVMPAMVNDDKFLQVPLTMAERAWSYAMQLRQESNTEPRKKFHLIARLRKAATYSLQLQELIEVDPALVIGLCRRFAIVADCIFRERAAKLKPLHTGRGIYVGTGPYLLKYDSFSFSALALEMQFSIAKRPQSPLTKRGIYPETKSLNIMALSFRTSVNCDARTKLEAQAYVAWMHGSLHFELQLWKPAMENLKKAQVVYEKLASALPEQEQMIYKARVDELAPSLRYCAYNIGDTSAIDDLMQMRGQLSGELLASLDSLMAQTREKQSSAEEVTWRGKTCGVIPPRAAGLLIADSRLNKTLSKAANNQAKIELLEAHLIDCKDAIAIVREHFKVELKNRDTDKFNPPQHLVTYLQHIRLSRTLERNLALIKVAQESENAKPQDIVRLYEAALHNVVEISQLQEDEEYQREQNVKTQAYRAFRCFYMAQSLVNLHRWREAMALYQRSSQHAKDALIDRSILPEELEDELRKLETSIEGAQYAAHAHSVLEEGHEEEPGTSKQTRSKKPLYERLHEYREDPSLLTKQPNVYKLPPSMQSIPCKPLFFDLAFNMAEFPDLSDKMGDQGKKSNPAGLTGFVKGLWGWGNK